ncbi:ATP synthase [Aspergillus crustosus]
MSSLRFARSALRARPAAFRMPLQRRGYAEAVPDKIKLSLVLPHQVNIPAESGEMGVLANHVPSIEQLKPGLVEIVEEGGANKKFFLSGGFAVVQPDSQLSINAVEGYPLEDFSAENVRSQIAEAQKIAGGNGSEQDIAEAKIELELPFSAGLKLLDENCFPGSYRLKDPAEWRTQDTNTEQERSAPRSSITQDYSRTLDRISGNGSCKDLLFTFPRLYSDLNSERDPFLESCGMPLNPQNTPISLSGRQSEIETWGKDKQDMLTPAKPNKHTQYRSSDSPAPDETPLTPLINDRGSTWRPPKPPKPSYLSQVALFVRDNTENAHSRLKDKSFEKDEDRRPLPETPHRSLPIRGNRKLSQPIKRSVVARTSEHRAVRPKHSWETRSIVPCRYFPRPFTSQELEILGIPLNNPEMPFPAPIPTVDNLPLRRGTIDFDWKQADGYSVDGDCLPTAKSNPPTTAIKPTNAIRQFLQIALELVKLTRTMLWRFTPWRQKDQHIKRTIRTRAAITIPFLSGFNTSPRDLDQVSIADPVDGAYILQIDLACPLSFVCTRMLTGLIRGFESSKAVQLITFIVWTVVDIVIEWLFYIFKVDFAVELRRI